ncbi:MAG: CPBP family intramembrane metalloprotease [Eubacteriales bacterium]|nr:CPBP family intramembrane metalloprotease [Eubacteriales bacterium]
MKNDKLVHLPGLSLFLCFCLLTGTGRLVGMHGGDVRLTALAELLSFASPFALAVPAARDLRALRRRLRPHRLPKGAIGLSIKLGVTVALLSLFLNLLVYQLAGMVGADLSATALGASPTRWSVAARLGVVVALSAVVEEFYLRGAMLSLQEQRVGTGACLAFSGLAFALLHGNLMNFAGPLLAGVAYAYLTYVFDSVWPAVLAHAVNNLYYLLVSWITDTYAAFGVWHWFAPVNALLLLLFLYLTLRALEILLARDAIPRFEKSAGLYDLWLLLREPGIVAFVLAFVADLALKWVG